MRVPSARPNYHWGLVFCLIVLAPFCASPASAQRVPKPAVGVDKPGVGADKPATGVDEPAPVPRQAQPGKEKNKAAEDKEGEDPAHFSDFDRQIVRDYFEANPGFASTTWRKRSYVPSWRQHVHKGSLAVGENRRLPPELELMLPLLPPNYERAIVGSDVVLIDRPNHLVVDMIRDVVR